MSWLKRKLVVNHRISTSMHMRIDINICSIYKQISNLGSVSDSESRSISILRIKARSRIVRKGQYRAPHGAQYKICDPIRHQNQTCLIGGSMVAHWWLLGASLVAVGIAPNKSLERIEHHRIVNVVLCFQESELFLLNTNCSTKDARPSRIEEPIEKQGLSSASLFFSFRLLPTTVVCCAIWSCN